jgi:outer membrane protein assembly factor BamB
MRGRTATLAALCGVTALAGTAQAQVPAPVLPPLAGQPQRQKASIGGAPSAPVVPAAGLPGGSATVALGGNAARSGLVRDYTIAPPLRRRWTVRSHASQLLAVRGRLFEFSEGVHVRARSARSGRIRWHRKLSRNGQFFAGAAYDRGVLFVQLFDDLVALDSRTGRTLWVHHLLDVAGAAQPVAAGGVVYAFYDQGGGAVVALRGSDGHVLWSSSVEGGSGGASLGAGRVYVGGACANATALARSTGRTLWRHRTFCSGGGDTLARFHAGRLWVDEREATALGFASPPVLSAATGRRIGRVASPPDVIADGVAIAPNENNVTARHERTRRIAWRIPLRFLRPPLVAGHFVVGVTTRAVAFDAATGILMWSAGRRIGPGWAASLDEWQVAVARGMVFASGGNRLHGYRSSLRPPPRRVGFGAAPQEVLAGNWTVLVGVLGRRLRAGNPGVRILGARWRHGRFRRFARVPSTRGGFRGYARVFRNARFRARLGRRRSRAVTVYAFPDVRLGRPRQSGGVVHVRARVRSPRTNLAGHALYLYIGHGRHVRRLGGNRLHGHRGRSRTVVSFRALRHVHRRDRVYPCVRGALRKGLGRPDAFGRRCGARRLRLHR